MATVTIGGKVATRKSTRQRKAPAKFVPGLKKHGIDPDIDAKKEQTEADGATSSLTRASTTAIDKKSKTIKKKAPATKEAPATKKAHAIKRTATAKKARVVESLATEAEAAMLPNLRGKIERARREKLFVMSRNPISNIHEEFTVTGSTGNLYTVNIGPSLSCSCRDFRFRRSHCKHMLVILLKMFHLHPSSPIFGTTKPDSNTLREIFSTCIPDPGSLIPEELKSIIDRKLKGETDPQPDIETQRRPLDTSDCPICCSEFDENETQDTLFCRVCGNNVHVECFDMWKKTKGHSVTCVYCRSPWEEPTKMVKSLAVNSEGFVNFGQELGLSESRDTTTYRDFPGRGFRAYL